MSTTLIPILEPLLKASVRLSVAVSRIGERVVRGRRAYAVYRRRYGYHA